MSVFVKGLKMPRDCADCPLEHIGFCRVTDVDVSKADWLKPADCPLVELPAKHGRLIDADALADDLDYDAIHYEEDHEMKANCASWLRSNATPTVIEAEGEEE